jgi:hypothetical protein
MDVNDAWEMFLIEEYIIYWYQYYLNQIILYMENVNDGN